MAEHPSSQKLRILARILAAVSVAFLIPVIRIQAAASQHLLYVASPGIRNYIDKGYKFVRRIPTWDVPEGKKPENVKGIAASAKTGRVYVTSLSRMIAIDAVTGERIWDKTYKGGCDRMAISPDGKNLYVPQLEGAAWHVVNAATGDAITTIETKSGSHNTIHSAGGRHVYLAGLNSKLLFVTDTRTNTIARTVWPFDNVIRPFTVNGSNTLVFVNINGLLGFEVGIFGRARSSSRSRFKATNKVQSSAMAARVTESR